MEQKKNDSCAIQKSFITFILKIFYFHSTFGGAVQKGFFYLIALAIASTTHSSNGEGIILSTVGF
jgi:hypothetical protein